MKNPAKKTRLLWLDVLAMLALPCVSAWYYYGTQALKLLAVSALSAVLCELFGGLLLRRKGSSLSDLSAIATGLMIALMLPASAPVWLPVCGSAFAILAAKLPFVNAIAGIAPLFFPGVTIFAMELLGMYRPK